MRIITALPLVLVSLSLLPAANVPSGFTDAQWTTGLSNPTAMAFAPDGRLFVCQQGGALRVITAAGSLLATPFVSLTVNSSGERGLLGIAFDPNFASNQYLYLYYTASSPAIHNRISRFTANGNVAVAGSELVILDLENLSSATNHNGGAMHFGLDGKLYVAVGENANTAHSQTLANKLGKMLRMNPDPANLIPADNPFLGSTSGTNQTIWALGLRNPFTFSVRPGTGRIFINDVGGGSWEEINDGIAGANYGWPTTEGYHSNPAFANPIFAYPHGGGLEAGFAITGGAFYVPPVTNFPAEYTGRYFFADYVNNWIRQLDPANGNAVTAFGNSYSGPVDLKVGPDGALYVLARGAGAVHRVNYSTQNQAPSITTHPANRTVTVGQTATFSVVASGSPTLTYQWYRNGTTQLAGATSASYTTPATVAGDTGQTFHCVVTNSFGTATSNAGTLTVVSNQPPTATITSPAAGTLYQGGQLITFSGTGTDPEDGTLPAGSKTWKVDFHHDTHTHPELLPFTGNGGSFSVPTTGETSTNVFYRITLTVTDSNGLTHTTTRDVLPRIVTITLNATSQGNPALTVTLDGQTKSAPHVFQAVVGMQRSIGTTTPQVVAGKTHNWQSWSDRGAITHTITVPSASATYSAKFRRQ